MHLYKASSKAVAGASFIFKWELWSKEAAEDMISQH